MIKFDKLSGKHPWGIPDLAKLLTKYAYNLIKTDFFHFHHNSHSVGQLWTVVLFINFLILFNSPDDTLLEGVTGGIL